MRTPKLDINVFRRRRERLCQLMQPESALVIPAHPEFIRNDDVHHEYRQDSSLYYLTGFEEPGAVLVVRPGQQPTTILFVRSKNPEREIWDGFRYGPEYARTAFDLDATYPIEDLEKVLPELLKPAQAVYYRLLQNLNFDRQMVSTLESVKASRSRSGAGLLTIIDSSALIGEMRSLKSDEEIQNLQRAANISAQAHVNAMRFCKPGVNERQVHAVLMATFLSQGSQRPGYGPIVASGKNATTLHYVFNDEVCHKGDLLLIDAGAEWNYYTGDITRTFPVEGKFSSVQRDLYEAVLSVQKSVVEMCRPGVLHKDLQVKTIEKLVDVMLQFKLLTGNSEEIIKAGKHKQFYPHGVSHFLGLDVHDSGHYIKADQGRALEPGLCITIEPGLYIQPHDVSVPEHFRGLGIRIEDDVCITQNAPLVLSRSCPKEVKDLEAIIGSGLDPNFWHQPVS